MKTTMTGFCKITALAVLLAASACGDNQSDYIQLTSITPDHGPQSGGNVVVVKGAGFASPGADISSFLIGNELALEVRVVSDREARVTLPASAEAISVDVDIFNSNGSVTLEAAYSYNPLPTVTAASPGGGPILGGTEVTLTGTGFVDLEAGDNIVDFDGTPATVLSVVSDTEMKVESPPGAPPKLHDISVTNTNGTGVYQQAFDYEVAGKRLLAYSHGLRPGYTNTADDPAAGQVVFIDMDSQTTETAIAGPGGKFVGISAVARNADEVMYKTLSRDMYTIDLKSGERTLIDHIPSTKCDRSRLTDIEYHQGVLYAFCRRNTLDAHFGTLDETTLEFTPVGPPPENQNSAQRTSLASDGTTLYLIGRNYVGNGNQIVPINPQTGLLSAPVPILLNKVRGATFMDGKLYVINNGLAGGGSQNQLSFLHELHPTTGVSTLIMSLGTDMHGLTTTP